MGSCENLTSVDEPSCDSVVEQHSCVEFSGKQVSGHELGMRTSFDMNGNNVNAFKGLDGCLGLCSGDNTCCLSTVGVGDTGIGDKNGLVGECRNVVAVGLEKVLDDACGVSRVCFNESQREIGVCNSPDRWPGLSQERSNICVSSDNLTEMIVGDSDGLVSECENMVGSMLEKLVDDDQEVFLNEIQSEADACSAETNGLCLEKRMFQGEEKSLEHCKFPSGKRPGNSSARNHDQQDDQKNGLEVNISSVESTVEVMEEETDVLAQVKVGNSDQTLSSESCGMPMESLPMTGSSINCVQRHVQKNNNIVSCLSGEEGILVKESDASAELEKGPCDQTMPFQSFEIAAKIKPLIQSPRNCVQQDDKEDDRNVSSHSMQGVMEGMEEKVNVINGIEKVTCDQNLPSQSCGMHSELLSLTGSPRNFVQEDDQEYDGSVCCPSSKADMEGMEGKTDALAGIEKVASEPSSSLEMSLEFKSLSGSPRNCVQHVDQKNDKSVGSSSLEGVMEVVEEKMVTCGQILPSQGCVMTCSQRNITQQDEQKCDEGISFPSLGETIERKNCALAGIQKDISGHMLSVQDTEIPSESAPLTKEIIIEEKKEFVGGVENDLCHPRSTPQHIELPMLVASTGLSSSSTKKYEQDGSESISCTDVEGKTVTSVGMEANMCNCISSSQGGDMFFQFSSKGDSMSSCEEHNDQMDHESHLPVVTTMEATEMKANSETRILALPGQSCQSSLESVDIADSVSNFSQQIEPGSNRTVDSHFAGSVTEAVEEKIFFTTDVKNEICSRVSPIGEILKEQSPRVASNCFVEKSASLQSCQPLAVGENSSCKSYDVMELSQKTGLVSITLSSAADSFGQKDHEGKDHDGVNCCSETNYPNIVKSSSRRSSRISISSRKTQTKRAARNCRRTTKVQRSQGSIDIIFNVARRKRSCFSKPARSSIWGLLGSITHIFGKSDVSSFSLAQNEGSQKARGGKGGQKQNKSWAGGSLSRSGKKCNASIRCLRLKVKVGKEICQSSLNVVVPEVVDTTKSDAVVVNDITELFPTNNSELPKLAHGIEEELGEEGTERQFQCFDRDLEEIGADESILDAHFANKDFEVTLISDKSAGDAADDNLGILAPKGIEVLGEVTENNYVDPGTSPDSEVINLAPDAELGPRSQEGLPKNILTSSESFAAPECVNSSKRGKKKTNLILAGKSILEDSSPVAASINKAKPPKKRGGRQKTGDVIQSGEPLSAFPGTNASSNSSSSKEFCIELLPSSGETEPGINGEVTIPSIESKGYSLCKNSKSNGTKKGRSKVSNSSRTRRKNASTKGENQQMAVSKDKVKENGISAFKRREKDACEQVEEKTEDQPHIDNIAKTDSGNNSASVDVANMDNISSGEPEHHFPLESAWVRCDDCYKWRQIPVSLANAIDENCRWVCKDNRDKVFADCSIPQEKSNADINAELGLSDYEEDDGHLDFNRSRKGLDSRSMAVPPGSSFRRIHSNVFLHRRRKTQTIDEVMVCHCKPPLDGGFGCGDECLNRVLNIECVRGTCPCGYACSNQQFQKRNYTKMVWHPYGKKGFGLELLEDISKGQFIIEYVGEVLDMHAYEARQKEYAANGHKHFYFMTLNGSEVIDACAKGNLGRFINHSCDPNCRTEKWMVNGEICIGLFAMRDIKKGEELTFDYNYVRVFGAAAKKCHCGSSQCRGYIGGDLQNSEIIYQGDSDEEFPEPVMVEEDETGDGTDKVSRTSSFYGDRPQIAEAIVKDRYKMDDSARASGGLEIAEVDDSRNQLRSSLEMEDSKGKYPSLQSLETFLQAEEVTSTLISAIQQEISKEEEIIKENSSLIPQVETFPAMISGKPFLDGSDANRKSKSHTVQDNQGFSTSRPRIKTSRKCGSVKKGKVNGIPINGNKIKMTAGKTQILSIKPKKLLEGSNGRFEAVQEKLNELLDADGGISKRKDAPKGYLKLLLLTAASGDSGNGEAIQSNRDLSMILDALLKTKSRMVLMDIINKNGLQMLHNMIKQFRKNFKKIPILRKLLKVLEYLAMREILTRNHITSGPPCPGMESFRQSILSLTEHDDKQVHQIARSFRDRWIPKPVRKHSYMDRDDGRVDNHQGLNCNRLSMLHNLPRGQGSRPSEAIDCVMQSLLATTTADTAANEAGSSPSTGGVCTDGSKIHKRKSRWDQPAKTNLDSIKHKVQKLEPRLLQQYESNPFPKRDHMMLDHSDKVSREDSNCSDQIRSSNHDEAVNSEDGGLITQEDVPPGFSSPLNPLLVSSDASSTTDLAQPSIAHLRCPFDVAIAHPRGKFNNRQPVSYGIPLHILQQFGSPQSESVDSWVIVPGIPFHPFPPLPPFPRDKKDTPPACAVSFKTVDGSTEEQRQDSNCPPNCYPDQKNPSPTGANPSDVDIPGADTQQTFKRMRVSSNDLGRRYFRQQKRKGPPWLWRRNELRNSYCSQDVSCRVDKPVGNFYQRPPQQNHH